MRHKTSAILVLLVSLGGMAFSGYLSYFNLWGPGCSQPLISCGGAKTVEIFGLPTCVYGFFMFLMEALLATIALTKQDKKKLLKWMFGLGLFGVLFAGVLAVYEIVWLDAFTYGIPACLYGFIFYFLIFLFALFGLRYQGNEAPPVQPPPKV